ncbi:MAG: substrate-binding domain-containing protein [Bryobacterales bacterium]|nr:substrate-binding domain-containing protein [Bryobacterales bacterium]
MKRTTALLSLLALMLAGCGNELRHSSTEKYYLVATNTKIAYWQEAASGLGRAGRELRVQAEMVGPDTYDANAQRDEFRRIVATKPAGILVSAGNAQVMKPEIDSAVAAGIPVVTLDADVPDSQRLFFVGTNNFQAGQMGGRLLGKLLNGKGNVVFYTIEGQENLAERLSGYRAALEAFPGIRVAQEVDMKGDAVVAFEKTKELLAGSTNIDAFVALEALAGAEIAEVLDRGKVDGKVVIAMDTAASTIEWIEKGKIAATIMQKPYTMGYYGLKALGEIVLQHSGQLSGSHATDPKSPFPVFIDTGTVLVDKANLSVVKQ